MGIFDKILGIGGFLKDRQDTTKGEGKKKPCCPNCKCTRFIQRKRYKKCVYCGRKIYFAGESRSSGIF